MRTSNPALNDQVFRGAGVAIGEPMTLQGTVNKTGVLLLCVIATAAWTWNIYMRSHSPESAMSLAMVGGIGGFIFALVTIFKKTWAPVTAPIYALLEGLVLGGVIGPVAQECYFRGFLLPRLARLGIWGVVLNAGLFSLYYVWAPGQILTRLLFLTPLIYAVWRTRDLRIGIWFQCFGNILAVLGALIPELLNFN